MTYSEIIGIVGSSKVTEKQHFDFIEKLILKLPLDTIIVTGDADGVDMVVRLMCLTHGRQCSIIYSKTKYWQSYKKRNQIIAEYSDRIISIALPLNKTPCYHCNSNTHEKTAGCYTGKINGKYEVKILPPIENKIPTTDYLDC